MTKRLLLISFTEVSRDVRICRHVEALSLIGEVTTIGYGETPNNVSFHYSIPRSAKYLPLSVVGVCALLTRRFRIANAKTQAVAWVKDKVGASEFDLVMFNDVQTISLANFINAPKVVIDMHEYAPLEMEEDWRFRLLLKRYYTWLCKEYLPQADHVTTVSPGLAEGYRKFVDSETDVDVIMNARGYMGLVSDEKTSGRVKLVHCGLAVKGRRLDLMIKAIGSLDNFELDLYLVEAPRQSREIRRLRRLAKATQNVRVCEPVPSDTLPMIVNKYDLALIFIAQSSFSLRFGIPNKLFDAVQAGVGVISGPSPEIKKIIEVHGFGHATEKHDVENLVALLQSLSWTKINEFRSKAKLASRLLSKEVENEKLVSIVKKLVDLGDGLS
jgi:hypothetical protein